MQHTPMFQIKIFLSVMNYSFSKLRRNLDASPTIFLEEEFVGVAEDEDQLEGNVQDVLDILLHHIFYPHQQILYQGSRNQRLKEKSCP